MANPVEIIIIEDQWTLVAENVTNWNIGQLDDTERYFVTYVDTGEPAPTIDKAGVFWEGYELIGSSDKAIDLYITTKRDNGLIEVRNKPKEPEESTPSFKSFQSKDFLLAVNMGQVEGHSMVDKFGENPDIDTGTAPADIWEFGGLYPYDPDGTAPIVSLVSDNSADTIVIEVTGLNINGEEVKQEITLTGTTRVALTTPLWRVYRMANISNANVIGTIYCYTSTGNSPADSEVRAIIDNGNNQTLMALYTIPKGKVGFLYRGELGASRSSNTGQMQCAYYSRRYGKVFRIKKRVDLTNQGTSIFQDYRIAPDIIPSLTDIRLSVESVSANNSGIFGTFDIMLVDETLFPISYLQAIGQVGY